MPILNPNKTVFPECIECGGRASVTLSFQAAASLAEHPADIVLIMDHSCSMDQGRMYFAKAGACHLVDAVAAATTGNREGDIGKGSRIGLVSFSTGAIRECPLTTRRASLCDAISALCAGGETNHAAAFEAAKAVLGPRGRNRQIAVMFTDGPTTLGADAADVTDRMKASGVEIYCIGLMNHPAQLRCWASEPVNGHVFCTGDQKQLDELFARVAARIVLAGAEDVLIEETVAGEFEITDVHSPSAGSARQIGPRSLLWTMDDVGRNLEPETLTLTFDVIHTGTEEGVRAVNESVLYQDRECRTLTFPSPTVQVLCASCPGDPKPQPAVTSFTLGPCQDAARVRLEAAPMSLGRIVQVDVTLKCICPGRRVAVSVLLNEVSCAGEKLPRGVKHLLVPAQTGTGCRDVRLGCIAFSLPEALNGSEEPCSLCRSRSFQARVLANYVDTDGLCCGQQEVEAIGIAL